MKSNLVIMFVLIVIVSIATPGCTKSSDVPASLQTQQASFAERKAVGLPSAGSTNTAAPVQTATPLTTAQLVTSGVWKVGSYMEGTQNGTSKFDKFTFTFSANFTVTANENGSITQGTWYERVAVFYYGIPSYGSGPEGFGLSFGKKRPLSLLSKNLFCSKKTTTRIYLDSVNPAEDSHIVLVKM